MQGIADYEFVRSLGAGGHGECFLARRPSRLPVEVDHVTVKVLRAASTADSFRRASRELRAVAAARSPYLITLYDVGQHGGRFFYSMEYVPDGSLAQAGPHELSTVLRVVRDAARAATALHGAGVVHRGIKPGNVLLTSYGGKLSDVDLAQAFTPGVLLTGLGPIGPLEFTDPDLLRGEPPGPHNDVWSIGALLHRLASGTGIYGELPGADDLAGLRWVASTRPEISSMLPARVAEIVGDCLARRSQRPAAEDVANQLDAAAG